MKEREKKRKRKLKEEEKAKNNIPTLTSTEEATSDDKVSKKSSKKQKRDKSTKPSTTKDDTSIIAAPPIPPPTALPPAVKLTPLQQSMRAKLASARFRHLNQTLYTTPSTSSLTLFSDNPEMFTEYHTGFAQQVAGWPENPVDGYVASILSRGKLIEKRDPWAQKNKGQKGQKPKPQPTDTPTTEKALKLLPRNLRGISTIADLGCGTASLSLALQPHLKPLKLAIHSFDLSKPAGAAHGLVTVADVAALPLKDGTVDVAVFCLALMGTNWLDFLDEAYRILRWRGELWVAEIKSRFGRVNRAGKVLAHSVGSQKKAVPFAKKPKPPTKAQNRQLAEAETQVDDQLLSVEVDGVELDAQKQETDVSAFVEVLRKRGFVLDGEEKEAVELGNRMFVKMRFVKGTPPVRGKNVVKEEEVAAMGGKKKMRYLEDLDKEEEDGGDEGAVLKPCVYKLR
ncbi:hypothetical protein BU16DRAFT_472268 [Lophium mytilinum]|uniref:Ribosomal RNA-processing protein 8 n=1 Tax=Lophium mytilinum TaxID=390894 RepID=A0A6A6Q9N3_9PEZI|nr:hypothetical protein BU16DRAFT_472268 [Lophium mytilinum]